MSGQLLFSRLRPVKPFLYARSFRTPYWLTDRSCIGQSWPAAEKNLTRGEKAVLFVRTSSRLPR